MDTKPEEHIKLFVEDVKRNGIAVTLVNDGHLLMFSVKKLRAMLKAAGDNEFVTSLVKHRHFDY